MRFHATYSNVVASISLFVALGGTSYAVARNSIGEPQLKNSAVTSPKVKDGTLTAADLAPGAVGSGPRGPRGSEGPAGAQGPSGGSGSAGPRGPSDVITKARTGGMVFPGAASGSLDVIALDNVPPGKWWVLGSGSAVYEGAGAAGGSYYRCRLVFGAVNGTAQAVSAVGLDATQASAIPMEVHEGRELTQTTTIRLRCSHDVALGGSPRFDHAQITAIRTDNLQVQAP